MSGCAAQAESFDPDAELQILMSSVLAVLLEQ
jgi:hypothetical protein